MSPNILELASVYLIVMKKTSVHIARTAATVFTREKSKGENNREPGKGQQKLIHVWHSRDKVYIPLPTFFVTLLT